MGGIHGGERGLIFQGANARIKSAAMMPPGTSASNAHHEDIPTRRKMIQTPNAPKNLKIERVVVNEKELTDQEKKRAARSAKKREKRAKRAEAEAKNK